MTHVDLVSVAVIEIRLFNVAKEGTALQDAFLMADDVLRQVQRDPELR